MLLKNKKNNAKKQEEQKEYIEIYHNEMLIACQNGKSCSYGICDECQNILGNSGNNYDLADCY